MDRRLREVDLRTLRQPKAFAELTKNIRRATITGNFKPKPSKAGCAAAGTVHVRVPSWIFDLDKLK